MSERERKYKGGIGMTARAQCMYACNDPTSNSPDTNRRQEGVLYGYSEFELDHQSGGLEDIICSKYISALTGYSRSSSSRSRKSASSGAVVGDLAPLVTSPTLLLAASGSSFMWFKLSASSFFNDGIYVDK